MLSSDLCAHGAGEEEEASLTKEKVKWLMPPGVRGTAVSESDDYEGDDSDEGEEEDEEEALIRRNRRRGRSAQRRSARQARRRSPSDPLVSHIRESACGCHKSSMSFASPGSIICQICRPQNLLSTMLSHRSPERGLTLWSSL